MSKKLRRARIGRDGTVKPKRPALDRRKAEPAMDEVLARSGLDAMMARLAVGPKRQPLAHDSVSAAFKGTRR
jgi:hypothetical protein